MYENTPDITRTPLAGFDWDEGNREKCQKHGVALDEIEALLSGPVMILPDAGHSAEEVRFLAVGKGSSGRHVWPSRSASEADSISSGRSALDTCAGRRSNALRKKIPAFRSDEEAERFVETAALSGYDLSGFKPARFEFEKKAARVNMRLPQSLLKAVKARARARGIPYQRFIREALEDAVTRE